MQYKFLLLGLTLVSASFAFTQNIPAFAPKPFTLRLPAFMPGIMDDPNAVVRNDTLIYNLRGQLFSRGLRVNPRPQPYALQNPWQTFYEMAKAYRNQDKNRIIGLYTNDSKQKIQSVLDGSDGTKILSVFSEAAQKLNLLAGFYYQQGFAVYSEDNQYGLHENYIRKEGNAYLLSGLSDKSSTAWNLSLYFKYKPRPMLPVSGVQLPDSLGVEDSTMVRLTVPETGRWAALYQNIQGPVMLLAQDNGMNDMDPSAGKIALYLKGNMFFTPGTYEVYLSSFNFPVQRVSPSFIRQENMRRIKIVEETK
jgi:hypothetical protein